VNVAGAFEVSSIGAAVFVRRARIMTAMAIESVFKRMQACCDLKNNEQRECEPKASGWLLRRGL
jgi:hypothetical protein